MDNLGTQARIREVSADSTTIVQQQTDDASLAVVKNQAPEVPDYLLDTYYWAYLNPRNVRLLDRESVVRTILWQQHNRLRNAAFSEFEPGLDVMQAACVYGDFSTALAEHVGPAGYLDIIDVARIQVANCRRKLGSLPQVKVRQANLLQPGERRYDVVVCYFLLHELPDDYKHAITNVLLARTKPDGKVVFVDYHKPHWAHPLKPITSLVFDTLEPFAKGLWKTEIQDFARQPALYNWRKETFFGGLFQKVVASRLVASG